MAKILIVDDQDINIKILKRVLQGDFETMTANDGQEAIQVLKEEGRNISAVLLDIVMPIMNGYEVLQEMQKDDILSKIPVIVTTTTSGNESELKALSYGAADFVTKPYNAGIIKQRLKNLIRRQEVTTMVGLMEKDYLTGIYNRDAFYQLTAKTLEENPDTEYDMVSANIEKFKLVNDTYGTKAGDRLLCYLADIFVEKMHQRGGICGRMTGDQFLMLIPRTEKYVEEVLMSAAEKMEDYPLRMKINLKFGIYKIEQRSIGVSHMSDRAILAGDQIKGIYHKYYAYYDEKLRQQLLLEQRITDEMETALAQEQFQVYLQPKYELADDKLAGAEALVRWIHPEMGFLSPADFIPVFEKNGFITKLDMYVWDKTCAIIEDWLKRYHKFVPVSVNVSRKDIYNADLPNVLQEMVKRHGLEPRHLHLEITESAYTENAKQLIEIVSQLERLGFAIEMDDFGSGYSSLNMLSELPIDILKLDMRFIQKERKHSRSILAFIVSIAKWMDYKVVAEGVETEAQIQLLRNMDCDFVQGYYYSKPVEHVKFTELLAGASLAKDLIDKVNRQEKNKIIEVPGDHSKVALIVDDSELNRAVLGECFMDQYNIVEADNGAVAYAYLKENYEKVAVILLDLIMPEMDGFEFMEKKNQENYLREIPVVVTSQAGENSESRSLHLGAADFIAKSYNVDVAKRRVYNVIESCKMQALENVRANDLDMESDTDKESDNK